MASAWRNRNNTVSNAALNIQRVTPDTPHDHLLYGHHIHQEAQFSPWKQSTFTDCFSKPYYGLLAMSGDEVLGYAIVLEVLDEATLMDIAVAKKHRGEGVGKSLLQSVIEISRQRKIREIWLEVRQSNRAAISLYETHAFKHIETRKNYYPSENGKENAVIMKWQSLA